MNRTIFSLYVAAIFSSAVIAADSSPVSGQVNGIEASKSSQPGESAEPPSRTTCLNRCNTAESRCSSEVRRARQQCSRNAANAGRDPFTGRNSDYGYFCSHFAHPARGCGSDIYSRGCQARFNQRHGLCLEAMHNIAAMRYDCFRSERDAQSFCRDELRDCKAACQ